MDQWFVQTQAGLWEKYEQTFDGFASLADYYAP